jgi:hypothetical protein
MYFLEVSDKEFVFPTKMEKNCDFFPSFKINKKNRNKLWFVVFNATFNNISVISWRSVLLVEETGVPAESCRQSLTKIITLCCIDYTLP